MARIQDKQKALKLRAKGYSYSQIKEKLGISKSTLSGWLYNLPLSEARIRELRADSPQRIERYRNTMRFKKEQRLKTSYAYVNKDIGELSEREVFIAGLFLFWGEGGKTLNGTTALSNTDPAVLVFFLKWLEVLKVPKEKLKARLHLYKDMNIVTMTDFWAKKLSIQKSKFIKPYIKQSKLTDLTYKNGYGKGTCMVFVANRELNDYILMGIKRIQDLNK